jgi:hypothetical protein
MASRPTGRQGDRSGRLSPPTATPAADTDDLPPVFAFDLMQPGYTLEQCRGGDWPLHFIEAMWRRAQLPWRDIRMQDHRALGTETLPRRKIEKQPNGTSIPDHLKKDEVLLVMRFGASGRMVGVRRGRLFQVIWLDTCMKLYDHGG